MMRQYEVRMGRDDGSRHMVIMNEMSKDSIYYEQKDGAIMMLMMIRDRKKEWQMMMVCQVVSV